MAELNEAESTKDAKKTKKEKKMEEKAAKKAAKKAKKNHEADKPDAENDDSDSVSSKIVMVLVAVAFFVTAKNLDKKAGIESIEDETAQAESDAEEIRKPENVVSLLQVDPIELEFGYGIIPLADVNQGGDLLDRVVMIRRQIALELGTVVPIIRLRDNIQLNPNQYIIKIKHCIRDLISIRQKYAYALYPTGLRQKRMAV